MRLRLHIYYGCFQKKWLPISGAVYKALTVKLPLVCCYLSIYYSVRLSTVLFDYLLSFFVVLLFVVISLSQISNIRTEQLRVNEYEHCMMDTESEITRGNSSCSRICLDQLPKELRDRQLTVHHTFSDGQYYKQ